MTSAWGNNGGATETEIITWKDTGCAKSLLISYGIHWCRRFAFEVNSEHGSVQGWDYSTHAGDAGVIITTLWCRQLTQQSGGAQLLSIIDHLLLQYFGLYRTRSNHSRTICCSLCVFSQKYRSYTGINNNIGLIYTVHALSATYRKDRLTGGGAFDRGAFYPGGYWPGWQKNRGHLTGGNWPGGGAIDLDSDAAALSDLHLGAGYK